YWRNRASDLRGEIASVDAEISFVNSRLSELPSVSTPMSYTVVDNAYPFGRGRRRLGQDPYGLSRSVTNVSQSVMGFRGTSVTGYPVYDQYGGPFYPLGNVNAFGYPYNDYDTSYERETLTVRLNELMGQRASLFARWRLLEEDARRAGAMPGWL